MGRSVAIFSPKDKMKVILRRKEVITLKISRKLLSTQREVSADKSEQVNKSGDVKAVEPVDSFELDERGQRGNNDPPETEAEAETLAEGAAEDPEGFLQVERAVLVGREELPRALEETLIGIAHLLEEEKADE